MDVLFRVRPDGALICWAPGLLQIYGWEAAKTAIKTWAWLRNMETARIRVCHGDVTFHARFRPPDGENPFRCACLCGWQSSTPDVAAMVASRAVHVFRYPHHFRDEICSHGRGTQTKSYGEVTCVECVATLGWDVMAQARLSSAA